MELLGIRLSEVYRMTLARDEMGMGKREKSRFGVEGV
jgi:hypothetical protein